MKFAITATPDTSDPNLRRGIAKRRYYEADTFGLYGDIPSSGVSEQDAEGAFRTYTRHAADIEAYERTFSAQIAAANRDYNTLAVQTLQANLQAARDYLVNQYALASQIGFTIDGAILVGEDQSSLYYRKTDSDFLNGTPQNDLLLGNQAATSSKARLVGMCYVVGHTSTFWRAALITMCWTVGRDTTSTSAGPATVLIGSLRRRALPKPTRDISCLRMPRAAR